MWINRKTTEYIHFNFDEEQFNSDKILTIVDILMTKVQNFKYLVFISYCNGINNKEIEERVNSDWSKWWSMTEYCQ